MASSFSSSGERTPRGRTSGEIRDHSPSRISDRLLTPYGSLTSSSGPRLGIPIRPGVFDRSVSSPAGTSQQPPMRGRPSRPSMATSAGSRLSASKSFKEDAEWTVFRQLLENESPARIGGGGRKRASSRATLPVGTSTGVSIPVSTTRFETNPTLLSSPPPASPLKNALSEEPTALTAAEQRIMHDEEEAAAHYEPHEEAYESDQSDDSDTLDITPPKPEDLSLRGRLPRLTNLQKNILKCAVAYLIASLFTFNPWLSSFISDIISVGDDSKLPSPSGHMIATVTVYFNPAKTRGGMFEADLFCLVGLTFAAFVSLSSMSMFWFFELRSGWEWLADVLVCVWIAVAMSLITWSKVYLNKPSFNTACSMCCIILFVVVVKEGGWDTLLQVILNVAIGSLLSNLVCFLLWPASATNNLRESMTTALDSFSTLLQMLTRSFLLEAGLHSRHERLIRAVEAHQASFTNLKTNLQQAHSEWVLDPRMTALSDLYDDAVDSLNRLAQHLAGLRSGTRLQYELIQAHRDGKIVLRSAGKKGKLSASVSGKTESGSVTENGETRSDAGGETDPEQARLEAAALMFGDLVDDVGSPLFALSSTCTSTLNHIRDVFLTDHQRAKISSNSEEDPHDFTDWGEKIERALFTFERTSNHALMRAYRRSEMSELYDVSREPSAQEATSAVIQEEQSHNENVFLVYFFIFTLQEFAAELQSLIDIMGRIHDLEQPNHRSPGVAGYFGTVFSSCLGRNKPPVASRPSPGLEKKKRPGLKKQFSNLIPLEPQHGAKVNFPKMRPHAKGTVQTPASSSLSSLGRLKFYAWELLNRVKDQDILFAFKVGVSTAVLAAPAFIERTRPMFTEYRGEWALISFFVVMGQTIGATNFLSVHRILGTVLGATTAVVAFSLFPENPTVLSLFGFFFSLPCFYYIVSIPQYATSGRFVLLTYNLTCLFCYNSRHTGISVVSVAIHRSLAVTIGVVWALIVSQFWWPSEARRELGKELGDFFLNIGWLYNRLVSAYSIPEMVLGAGQQVPMSPEPAEANETTSLLPPAMSKNLNSSIRDFMAMELHLQIRLIYIQKLLAQTVNEPRLKGPFPVALYRSILTSLQRILDMLHSMRCVTTREEWYTNVRRDFIVPVNKERREMVGNTMLYFAVLSSAFRLKAPLPPYLPPAEQSRQRLVEAIRKLDVVKKKQVQVSRQLLYFAYALMMKGVIQELDYLGRTVQEAFGVIGQSREEFEALFRDDEGGYY